MDVWGWGGYSNGKAPVALGNYLATVASTQIIRLINLREQRFFSNRILRAISSQFSEDSAAIKKPAYDKTRARTVQLAFGWPYDTKLR